jgi:small subunit ribosomal protein S19e
MAKTQITPHEISSQKFIPALAEELKKMPEFKIPEWAFYVKTGTSRARPPIKEDWWYMRASSILRSLYMKGIIGVSRLRNKYGSRKNRGMQPEKFFKSSGKIIRVILQQSGKAGLTEVIKDPKAGRRLTKKGKAFMEELAEKLK